MKLLLIAITAVGLNPFAAAADKPDFSGTWRIEGGNTQSLPITVQQSGTDLSITTTGNPEENTQVTCTTMGKQCEGKLAGEAVKVSYWFNGPALVEMAMEGKNRVTQTRRTLSDDGQKMFVHVLTIMPSGKGPEELVFVREQQVASDPGK